MADAYFGEIRAFAFGFAPMNWLNCDGMLYPINQYQALFSIIGNKYGGDGQNTFAVPDLRGYTVVGFGNDPVDAFDPIWASKGGDNFVALGTSQIPPHSHTVTAAPPNPATLRSTNPAGDYFGFVSFLAPGGTSPTACRPYIATNPGPTTQVQLNPNTLSPYLGQGQAHENRQPYLAIRFCICAYADYYPVRPT